MHQNDNAGVHQNENTGVHQNPNTHSPQSGNNDTQNDPTIKTENTIFVRGNVNEDGNDAENEDENEHDDLDEDQNEHEDLEEAPTNNYSTDEEPNNATDPDTMSNTMDKQYGARTQMNMRARKQKSDLPPKLRIHLTMKRKRLKILHANAMVQNIGNTHLDLRDYPRIHATIHCGPNQHNNVMRNPLITTILTKYHVSKGLKFFGESGVASVLKELKQLHDIMVMDPKNSDEMTTSIKKASLEYLMFLKQKR